MKPISLLFLVILMTILFVVFFPGTFHSVTGISVDGVSEGIASDYQENTFSTTEEDSSREYLAEPVDKWDGVDNVPLVCRKSNHALPDYLGTNKEGSTCADVPVDQDLECVSNPPENYDGTINLLTKESTPLISCCVLDGECYWN